MPELAASLDRNRLARVGLASLERQHQQIQVLTAQFRLSLNGWVRDGFGFGDSDYAHDEYALAFCESPGTAQRTIGVAQMFADYPSVVARVGLKPSDGGWSIRHADAALDAVTGMGTREQQEQILDMVAAHPDARTPHQIRKAIQAALMVLDPEAAAKRFEKAKRDRKVSAYSHDDGAAASFWATGTTAQIAQVMASIDAVAGPKQPGEDRSLDQRRFDAFMDLICGRVQPGQWQAVIVMTLATMDGGDEPAEIPGYGLVSAEQARELIPHAELRRAVVGDDGELVSLDTRTHTPDQVPEQIADPARQVSNQSEPEPLDLTPEHPPTPEDLHWLDQQQHLHQDQDVRSLQELVRELTSDLETGLRALLDQQTLASASASASAGVGVVVPVRSGIVIETHRIDHRPDTGGSEGSGGSGGSRPPSDGGGSGGGSGGSRPPAGDDGPAPVTPEPTTPEPTTPEPRIDPGGDPPDEPPPTLADELWHDSTLDREAQDAFQPRPVYEREPDPPYGQRPKPLSWTSSWSLTALRRARDKIRTAPLEPRPADSRAYALPPRLARYVKTRDITCTFPHCTRLSRQCENDHLIPWPQGPTAERNITSGCKHHHLAKHHYFTVEKLPHGTIRWHTPLGRHYDRNPRPLLRGW